MESVEVETSLSCGLWCDEKSCPHSEKGQLSSVHI